MDRAKALRVVSEICSVCQDVNINGILLNKIEVTNQYAIFLRVSPNQLPRNEIQRILDIHNLVMREEIDFVFIHSS